MTLAVAVAVAVVVALGLAVAVAIALAVVVAVVMAVDAHKALLTIEALLLRYLLPLSLVPPTSCNTSPTSFCKT